MRRLLFILLLFLSLLPTPARAQTTSPATSSGPLQLYLVTIGSGPSVEEVFGHNGILFVNTATGDQYLYNWGVFDFEQKNFIANFIQGRMIYAMDADPDFDRTVANYARHRRSLTVRQLNLSQSQILTLVRACIRNNAPENRNYRYDYYNDNCSTRVRDMIDLGTAGQIKSALASTSSQSTFRSHTNRLTQKSLWLYPSLIYLMGHPIDHDLSQWAECFLPAKLQDHLAQLTITWEDGTRHPLLGPPDILVPETRGGDPLTPPGPLATLAFLTVSLLWSALAILLAKARNKWLRRLSVLSLLAWSLISTLAGLILTWCWFFTDHIVARQNENLLQLSPLSLPLFLALCTFLLRPKKLRPPHSRWPLYAAALPLALSLLGFAIKVLPSMIQPNWPIILLALPLHLTTFLLIRRLLLRTPMTPTPTTPPTSPSLSPPLSV